MEFLKSSIGREWMDLVDEFPEFILELSPMVRGYCPSPEYNQEFCNLRYGFECDIGWKDIIHEYFTQIRDLINKAKESGDEIHYKTCIFKEKFGELRDQGDFYGPDYKKYYNEYGNLSESLLVESSGICEKCGEVGFRRSGGWIKTLCDAHYKKQSE